MAKEEEEYELIPLSPLRRLEKRIERIESSAQLASKDFYKELVEIVRLNQQIVDELAKANDALRLEISRLPARLEELISKLDELLGYIKAAAEETAPSATPTQDFSSLISKLDELIQTNKKLTETQHSILTTLEGLERRMRKPVILPRRPQPPRL